MEFKRYKINPNSRLVTLKDAALFGWELNKEEDNGKKLVLTFQRDENIPHRDELDKLEKEYYKTSSIPMWILYVLAGFCVVLLTLALVINIAIPDMKPIVFYLAFLFPGILFVVILAICSTLRTRQMLKYVNNYEERYKIYLAKVKDLQHEEEN